jgi:hypothetical protein
MSDSRVVNLILTHVARYPEATLVDVYKLLHQATFGPGHLIPSKKAAREWLEQELSQLVPSRVEPLIEAIHPDGAVVRLHLRPYLAYQGASTPLLEAFIRSAEQIQGEPDVMLARWQTFDTLCREGTLNTGRFPLREISLFGQIRQREQWPAVHHSPPYEAAYHPKYRVLTRAEAEALCRATNAPFDAV